MKKYLYLFLSLFVLIDALLAVQIFIPGKLFSSTTSNERIFIISDQSTMKPVLTNTNYLLKKLDERGFWNPQAVNLYKKQISKTTVKKIFFILTDKPQPIQIQVQKINNSDKVILSYSQKYNPTSQEMTLILHVDRSFSGAYSSETMFSGIMLYTIFDLTYDHPRNKTQFKSDSNKFMKEFLQNPEKMLLVKF